MNGVMKFSKKVKLSPQYIGPFEVLEYVGPGVIQICSTPNVHPIFHVSMYRNIMVMKIIQ